MPGQNWQGFQYDPNKGPIEQQLRAFLAGRPFFGSSAQMDPRWMTTASVLNGGDDGGYRNVQIATNPNARGNSETGMYYVGPDGRDYNRIPLSRADSSTGLSAAELGIGNDPYLVQTVMGISPQEWANYSEQDKQNILNQAYFKPDNLHGFGDIQYSPDGGVVTSTSSIRDPNIRHDNWLTAGMFAAVAGPALAGAYGGAGAPDMFGPGGGLAPEEAAGTGWGGTTPAGGAGGATGGAGGAAGGGAAGGATGGLGSLATPGNLIRGAGLAASLAGGGGAGGMGGGGGGGGGSGNMQYQWSDEMRPRWQRNLDRSEEIANRPYTSYTGQRIAGLSGDEQTSIGGLRDLVANGGTALGQAGSDYTMGMLGGSGLTGMFADPYANMGNRYSGESPEFQNVINSGLRDMGDAYDRVARDTNRRAAAAGVFGGSDHNANADVNEGAYGKRVGDFVSQMRNDQYQRSAVFEESRLGRGSSAWQAGLGRMSDAARMAQGDQAQALARLGALGQAGGIQRGINQSQNDFDYQQFTEGRDWDRNQAGWLTGMFGTAQGGQFPTGGGQGSGSNAMNWAGLGLSALGLAGRAGLFNGWGSGSDMWASGTGSPWYSGMDAYG